MRVLDVVDRVVERLAGDRLDVELDRRVEREAQHGVPEGVLADLVEQVVDGGDVAGPLAHLGRLAGPDQADQLADEELGGVVGVAEGPHDRPHPRHVPVVVGAPEEDQPVEPAPALVPVVGGVGTEVGRGPVGADQRAVLVVAELGGAQPHRPVALLDHAPGAQVLDGLGDGPGVVQGALGEPDVELDPEPGQGLPDPGQHAAEGPVGDAGPALGRVEVGQGVALLGPELCGHVGHVRALVAVGRHLGRPAQELEVGRLDAGPELLDLVAGVVEVVLALDLVAGGGEQVGQGVAHRRQAGVADVQGAGRVGRDELDVDPLAVAEVDGPERLPGGHDPADQAGEPALVEPDVDEAGAGHLDPGHPVGQLQVGDHGLGDLPGRRLGRLGQDQGHVGGPVAVLGQPRPLQRRLGDGARVEVEGPGRDRALQRGPEELGQVPLDGEDGGGHDTPGVAAPRSCWAMIPATRCRS